MRTEQMYLRKNKCAVPNRKQDSWHSINWKQAECAVRKLQSRIVKAEKEGKSGKVKALQRLLTCSFYGKALAIKKVTDNQNNKAVGIDGVKWNTPKSKWEAISTLKKKGYRPVPLKRVYIPKNGCKKLRPISIPSIKDKAMQALHLMTLAPIAETRADKNSYGFRIGRCCADAIQQSQLVLSRKFSPRWILEADIKSCFDTINHQWILDNIPMDKSILEKWLKSGYIYQNTFHATSEGSPQGGIVSPTICNTVLDGLEDTVRKCGPIKNHGYGRLTSAYKINFIRYCDDFIITASMKEVLDEKVIPVIKAFLEPRGLILSEEKTKITRIEDGFDFLGQNIRKYGTKLLITPSNHNLQSLFTKIKTIFAKMKAASAWALIRKLNPVLKGWAYFHRHIVAKATYSKVDHFIFLKLRRWLKRKHPDKSWKWINRKYYHHPYSGKSQFFDRGKDNEVVTLFKLGTLEIKRHVKIKGNANPFDPSWELYFEDRHDKKMLQSTSGKLKKLYLRQEGRCKVYQAKITRETGWNTHHVVPKHLGGSDNLENLQLLHPNCHKQLHSKNATSIQPQQTENQPAVSFA